jgi:hypothetical protein
MFAVQGLAEENKQKEAMNTKKEKEQKCLFPV